MGAIINNILERDIDTKLSEDILDTAGNIILNSGTVIFPTETVYGLGANALDKRAANRIFKAKGRPQDNPLIVHVSSIDMLLNIVTEIDGRAKKLIDKFWPGPLTMIFYKKDVIPDEITGGLETVAVRMPSNKIALKLIEKAGVPIAAPSANISGRPSITSGNYAEREMSERVDMILISEDSEIGIESTVVDMTTEVPIVLRPGKISQNEIIRAISSTEDEYFSNINKLYDTFSNKERNEFIPKSPGMKYTHYSPEAKVFVLEKDEIVSIINKLNNDCNDFGDKLEEVIKSTSKEKIKVFTNDDNLDLYGDFAVSLGKNIDEVGRNLFKSLRYMDDIGVEIIIFEKIESINFTKNDFWNAILNRVIKASE